MGELMARPVVTIRLEGRCRIDTELPTPVLVQRIQVDSLDRTRPRMLDIVPAPSGGVTHIRPVRSTVTATAMARAVDEGLHQYR